MAADVIESPKLSTLKNTSLGSESAVKAAGPFRATQLWNDIIDHMKDHIEVKRRRVKLRNYESCFTGTEAVDVVLDRLQAERLNFTREVSRDKAVKLCQLLMENHVFELATPGSEGSFDDSSSKYYRFTEEKPDKENLEFSPVQKQCSRRLSQDFQADLSSNDTSVCSTSVTYNKHGQIVQELMDITGAWKRYSSECLRKMTPAKLFAKRASLPDCSGSPLTKKPAVSAAVEEAISREVALRRLLQMVELNVLDSILSYDPLSSSQALRQQKKDMAFSNLAFKRNESLASVYEDRTEDPWMEAAIDCLECLPRGVELLDVSLSEDTDLTQKLRIFQFLVEAYSGFTKPIWSQEFDDLQVALYNLLMQGRVELVMKALQLSITLLPRELQEEMKRLLTFMKVTSCESNVRLSVKHSNREQVEMHFVKVLIQSKVLAPHQVGQLILFMMDHVEHVFSLPNEVEDEINISLQQITTGISHARIETSFCQRISTEEFLMERVDATERALVQLMNDILDNTSMSLKDKKKHFKRFQKQYPEIHSRHFSDIH